MAEKREKLTVERGPDLRGRRDRWAAVAAPLAQSK